MIKFFRNIRQKSIKENKVTNYLKYAFGEIILVVVGILIAVSINNWNERLKNKTSEQELLISLLQEFETNLEILNKTIQTNTTISETCVKIGEFTGPSLTNINEKEISQYMMEAFKNEAKYIPNNGIINEANNSGKLSLISDSNLRKSISTWLSQLKLVARQEEYVVEQRNNAHQFFIDNGNFRRHLDIIDEALIDVKPSKFPNNDFRFLKSQRFESNLYLFLVTSMNLNKKYYLPLKKQTEFLIEQLENNIK